MKPFYTLILLLAFSLQSFAGVTPDTPVLKGFQKKFGTATEVSWTSAMAYHKAEFWYNGQYITAYFDASGNLLSATRNILSTQLPVLLESNLKEGYAGYWITSIVEFSSEEETAYYTVVENADQCLVLKSTGTAWTVSKRLNK